MTRYANSAPQILKKNSDGLAIPIEGAKKYFYETGTLVLKTIYSDSDLTISTANPVTSDADGRFPEIFLNGVYREVQKDSDDTTVLWDLDPVGEISTGQFQSWVSNAIYNIPDIVKGSDDEYYKSLTDNNTGNDPTSDAVNWQKITLLAIDNAAPNIPFNETDGSVDNKKWDFNIASEQFQIRLLNDAEAVQTNILEIDRTGTTVDTVNFANGTLQNEGNDVLHDGNTTIINYDVLLAKYQNKSFSVTTQETVPSGLAFSSDGLTMFVVGQTNVTVYQYTLTTAWDVSTASYASKSFSVAAQETVPQELAFSSDGLTMFVVGQTNDTVYQYTLTTAWDVSTASYASKSFSVAAQETTPQALAFSSDGFTMLVVGVTNDTVYQYALTTAWDVSTASYASKSFSVAAQETTPTGLAFSSDGFTMLVIGDANDTVYQYTLTTAWDVSTASYASKSFSVAAQETTPTSLAFSADGFTMFVVGTANDTVYQYSSNYIVK
jgi:sugar lactone lactonase YvrE